MNTFCTIITANYKSYAQVVYDSIVQFNKDIELHVLVVDEIIESENEKGGMKYYSLNDIGNTLNAQSIIDKYLNSYTDGLRWSLKSIFLYYLLNELDHDKVLYVDSDIYFYNDYSFLFDELNTSNVLLSPHWRSCDPERDATNFNLLFVEGIFNGGFIGVAKGGNDFLKWWANSCGYACEKNNRLGRYVDQKFLDIAPVYFDKIRILKHRGCNVANWNQLECQRAIGIGENQVLINKQYPIIFLHLTKNTINSILMGTDNILIGYVEAYQQSLQQYLPEMTMNKVFTTEHIDKDNIFNKWFKRMIRYKLIPMLERI